MGNFDLKLAIEDDAFLLRLEANKELEQAYLSGYNDANKITYARMLMLKKQLGAR